MSSQIRFMTQRAAIALVVGSIIGSGIFMKPASMAAITGSAPMLILVWVVAGLLSICGALIFAEAGAMFPEAGGLYAYLKHMFGRPVAFLYGWAGLTVINTAAIAAIAFVCALYCSYIFPVPALPESISREFGVRIPFIGNLYPLQDLGIKLLAIAIMWTLTWLNTRSLKGGQQFQVISTAAKVLALFALVGGIFISGNGSLENMVSTTANNLTGQEILSGAMAALTGAFVAYDGWQNLNFMGAEIQQPEKNIPRSLIKGVLICMIVYVSVNLAYTYALPVDKLAGSRLVASDAMYAMLGNTSSKIIAALIVLTTIGAVNGNVMSVARVTQAMSNDRLFIDSIGKIHPVHATPANALKLHAVWSTVLIVSGSFDMLADMFVFVTWIFIIIACMGLVRLRAIKPGIARPYKMPGYPLLLWLFVAFAVYYVCNTIWYEYHAYRAGKIEVLNSILGLAITLLGLPVYYIIQLYKRKQLS